MYRGLKGVWNICQDQTQEAMEPKLKAKRDTVGRQVDYDTLVHVTK
mgnify:CR=1 FL=1